ncbi:unnamed protein product [Caenorhabditis bovis]|uniref:Mitochondrial import inner membrane translocase subunit TIM50 n=1 Tax=Caenorhabditis bovis TaxID=2654633 RepID=A0A8S1ECQ4_9PELO|nr:unnamed protein product [Caenorhabditis bovis]
MSLSKLGNLSRPRAAVFIKFFSSEFRSQLGGPKVPNPFKDPARTIPQTIISQNNGSVYVNRKIAEETNEAVDYNSSSYQKIDDLIEKNVTPEKNVSKPDRFPEKIPEEDDFSKLKNTLEHLEAAAARTASSSGGSNDDSENIRAEEIEKRRIKMERNTRIGGMVLAGSSIIGLIAFCVYYGRPKRDENGNVIEDEFTGSILAPFYRIANSFKIWRDYVVEPAREQLLPDPLPAPYLQPKYTIVIEIKNVLVHPEWTYKTGYRFLKRPALDYFLDVIGYPNFEVVVYSSESMMTAAPVVDSFDPKQRIMYKLFRDCTKYMNGHHVKDLSKLNRDLSKVIFIDFDPKSGQLNPENMLRVPEWKGNMDDTSLVDLAELLKTIHLSDPEDVRPMIQYYSQYDDPAKEFRRRAIYLAEQESQKHAQQEDQSMIKRYTGKLFGFRRHASV